MASEHVEPRQLRAALDAVALRSVRVIALVLSALFAVLATLTPIHNPGHVAFFAAQLSLNSALCLALFLSLRRWHLDPRWAHPILSGLLAITLSGSFTQIVIQADPLETAGVMLNAIAVGLFMTSAAWFIGALAGIALTWGIAVWLAPPSPLYAPLGTLLAQGFLLSVMIFVVRVRGLRRLETIRAQDARQQRMLERLSGQLAKAQQLARVGSWEWDIEADRVSWSDETYRIFELPQGGEVHYQTVLDHVHLDDRERVRMAVEGAMRTGTLSIDHRLLTGKGKEKWVHGEGSVLRADDGAPLSLFGTVQDITQRKLAERRLAAEHAAIRVLAEGDGIEETAHKLLDAVSSALGWEFAAVWLVDDRDDVLRCVSTWRRNPGERSAFEEITRGRTFARGIGLPGRVWASGEPAWIEDVTVDSNFPRAPYASSEGLHGAFGFPIRIHARTIGVFEFFSGRIQKPDPDLLHLMASVGGTFGLFMERRRAEDELTRVNSELTRTLDELGEKTRDLESFSQSASHDLRAPLRAISFLAGVLEEEQAGRLDASGREALARLRREAGRMGQLIEDLLKLSRTTGGDIHPEPVDVGALAIEVVQDLRQREPSRDVEAIIRSPIEGEADPRLLKVALENLIGNAWKYTSRTPSAKVEVGAILGKSGEPTTYFVRDNGVGFDKGQASKLFQPFQRLHGREFPGTGIGLTTVQRIIQRHGGRVWAESEVGHGATFYFTLRTQAKRAGATGSHTGEN